MICLCPHFVCASLNRRGILSDFPKNDICQFDWSHGGELQVACGLCPLESLGRFGRELQQGPRYAMGESHGRSDNSKWLAVDELEAGSRGGRRPPTSELTCYLYAGL